MARILATSSRQLAAIKKLIHQNETERNFNELYWKEVEEKYVIAHDLCPVEPQ